MGVFTYPRSEPGSGGHLDLVEALESHVATLRAEVAGLPESTLTARPEDGAWSIKEVCGHLCDIGRIMHERLFKTIHLEEPRFEPYDPDALAAARNAQQASSDDLLAEYAAQRAATVELLSELVHWSWARTGRDPIHGRSSVRQQVERWLAHEREHFDQIRRLKAQAPVSA